ILEMLKYETVFPPLFAYCRIGTYSSRPKHQSLLQEILESSVTEGMEWLCSAFSQLGNLHVLFTHGFERELVARSRHNIAICQRQFNPSCDRRHTPLCRHFVEQPPRRKFLVAGATRFKQHLGS